MADSPLVFKCGRCRAIHNYRGTRFVLTGRTRAQWSRFGGIKAGKRLRAAYQYQCPKCGNVGWGIHTDLAEQAVREGLPSPDEILDAYAERQRARPPRQPRNLRRVRSGR